jgi:putative toxin-antitoxin system antitoxin component (TIGR02293 family)
VTTRFSKLDLKNEFAIVLSARKGIKTKIFYDFATTIKMPEKNLAELINLNSRTISNYATKQKSFEPIQSEHLLKLIALYVKGEEIFGNVGEFNYWLQKPFWNSKEKPIDWLVTPGGVDLLMDELDRLAHAYVV